MRRSRNRPTPIRPPAIRLLRRADAEPRRLVVPHPDDAEGYQAAVARVTPWVERASGPQVLADRAVPGTAALRPWGPARSRWGREVRRLASAPVLGVTDVRDCFGSIAPEVVVERLLRLGVPPAAAVAPGAILSGFAEVGVRGLPVGPSPSAILANAVLTTLDETLRGRGIPHVRWVDDVVFAAPDVRTARAAIGALHRAAEEVGLVLHEGKIRVLEDPDERSAFATAGVRRTSRAGGPRVA